MGNAQGSFNVAFEHYPSGGMYLNNAQNDIPNAIPTKVLLETVIPGFVDAMEYLPTNYLNIMKNGLYLVIGCVTWNNTVVDTDYQCQTIKNASTLLNTDRRQASKIGSLATIAIAVASLVDGDYIQMKAYHNAGAATPDILNGVDKTFLIAMRIK